MLLFPGSGAQLPAVAGVVAKAFGMLGALGLLGLLGLLGALGLVGVLTASSASPTTTPPVTAGSTFLRRSARWRMRSTTARWRSPDLSAAEAS
jgi:hypothetical protein